MRKIALFISVIFFISCSNQLSNEEDVPSFETEITNLREINNELINTSPKEIKTVFKLLHLFLANLIYLINTLKNKSIIIY